MSLAQYATSSTILHSYKRQIAVDRKQAALRSVTLHTILLREGQKEFSEDMSRKKFSTFVPRLNSN
jgi:hypothetical protein